MKSNSSYKLENWEVFPKKNLIRRGDKKSRIEAKAMQVLDVLVNNAGEIVSRDKLMEKVWPEVYVSENTLSRCISILRKELEDSSSDSEIIQTIKGEGYRIISEVEFPKTQSESNRLSLNAKRSMLIIISIGVILLSVIGLTNHLSKSEPINWEKVPIGTTKFDEISPVISPDGSRIAYACYFDDKTKTDIYIKMSNSSEKVIRITDFEGDETCPTWSPDGQKIAYNMRSDDENGLYVISALGGTPKKIGTPYETIPQQMAWSNDGKFIAYSDRESPADSYSIYLMETSTGKKIKLTNPTFQHWGDYYPSFSPDDKKLSFIRAVSTGTHDIYIYDFKSKQSERLTFQTRRVAGQAWTDKDDIIYAHEEGQNGVIWKVSSRGGSPQKTNISGLRPSIDKATNNLVVEDWKFDYDIFTVDLSNPLNKNPYELINSSYEDFDPIESPCGKWIAFVSNRSGSYQVWLLNKSSGELSKLTDIVHNSYINSPAWSNDSNQLTFTVFTTKGNADVYLLNLKTNKMSELLNSKFNEQSTFWNLDDTGIFYTSNKSGIYQIWFLNLSDLKSKQVTEQGGFVAIRSKNSNQIFYSKYDKRGIWKISNNSKNEEMLVDDLHLLDARNFDVDRNDGVYYIMRESTTGPTSLNYFDKVGGKQTISTMGFSKFTRIKLSNDGTQLLGSHTIDLNVDVVLYKLTNQ